MMTCIIARGNPGVIAALTRCKLHKLLLGFLEAEPLLVRMWLLAAGTGALTGVGGSC